VGGRGAAIGARQEGARGSARGEGRGSRRQRTLAAVPAVKEEATIAVLQGVGTTAALLPIASGTSAGGGAACLRAQGEMGGDAAAPGACWDAAEGEAARLRAEEGTKGATAVAGASADPAEGEAACLRAEVEALEAALAQLGGASCGWEEEDHAVYLRSRTQVKSNRGRVGMHGIEARHK
jgi:hypothetical protein